MHFIFEPLAGVLFSIGPVVPADATYLVLIEFAFVVALLGEDELAASMFSALVVLALVPGAIRPALLPVAVLLVLEPLALVLSAVHVRVGALAVRLVVEPVALVRVAVSVVQLAVARRPVLPVVALVARTVRPLLHPETVPGRPYPLPRVYAPVRQCRRRLLHTDRLVVHTYLFFTSIRLRRVAFEVCIVHSLIVVGKVLGI
jgi:hypothetical protein